MNPPPLPFGDPTRVNQENRTSVKKGLLIGCSIGLAVLLGVGLFIAAIISVVFGSMRNSSVVTQAMAKVNSSVSVKHALGEPVEMGWSITGSIHVSNDRGSADVQIPISGPKGSATLHAVAQKEKGEWIFSTLTVSVEGQRDAIDLLHRSPVALQLRQQFLMHPIEATVAEDHDHITTFRS